MDDQCPTKQRKLSATDHEGFSSLLEPLIHRIFSFLPLRGVLRASTVCKSWRQAYSSFPILDFRGWEFLDWQEEIRGPRLARMIEFVDATMTRFQERHLKIDKFKIYFSFFPEHQEHLLEKWIAIALDRNAEDIFLDVTSYPKPYVYWDLERILSASSVKSLEVRRGHFSLLSCDASINLSSLWSLTLKSSTVDDLLFQRLMSRCHLLELLSLDDCSLTELKLSGLPNIKTLLLQPARCTRLVEIDAPSLESFRWICYKCDKTCVLTISNCPNLKSLELFNVLEDESWFQELISRFPLLQDLTISSCPALQRIGILNPFIKSLKISGWHRLTDILFYVTPELIRFRVELNMGCRIPSLQMMNSNPVAELFVDFPRCSSLSPDMFTQLKEFLVENRKYLRSLCLRAQTWDYAFELHSSTRCQWVGIVACNFPWLNIAPCRDLPSIISEEVLGVTIDATNVNGLIWTPHPTTVTVVAALSEEDFFQFLWENVAERHGCSRLNCTSYPKSSLGGQDDVKIEIVTNRKQLQKARRRNKRQLH